MDCKDWVCNEALNLLVCLDLPEYGLSKLSLREPSQQCFPLEDDVVFLLASNCTRLQHLKLSYMSRLD